MKKPRFKPRFFGFYVCQPDGRKFSVRCRVTDARDLTAEKAVENALQAFEDANGVFHSELHANSIAMARAAGFNASKKNGKVRVRRLEK